MKKNSKIFVAGHNGMVGSAIHRTLKNYGYHNILSQDRILLDLSNKDAVFEYFQINKPEYVFLAAAKVGGILANKSYPVEFILENLKIQNSIIEASANFDVKRLLFLGSSCVYPKNSQQPIKEEYLLSGYLEETNKAYALAKIAGIELCNAYHKQYGKEFFTVMPCNLYGINDNYDLENSHVIPALIRKFHEAKVYEYEQVEIWGDGTPLREFLFVDDLAMACIFLMNKELPSNNIINVGSDDEFSIFEIALLIKNIVGYEGKLVFNKDYPNGVKRKKLDTTQINKLGWRPSMNIIKGIKLAYEDFKKRYCLVNKI